MDNIFYIPATKTNNIIYCPSKIPVDKNIQLHSVSVLFISYIMVLYITLSNQWQIQQEGFGGLQPPVSLVIVVV